MKNPLHRSFHKTGIKGRPDYYLTPTHDFTQYTRDCEEKYWSKETAFDWNQNVRINLEAQLENLDAAGFSEVVFMTLPMILEALDRKIEQIRREGLPVLEDALKDIGESLPFDKTSVAQAVLIQSPLEHLQSSVLKMRDELEISQKEFVDLSEQQKLGLYRIGTEVKRLEKEAERKEQALELSRLKSHMDQVGEAFKQLKTRYDAESQRLQTEVREKLFSIEPQVLAELEDTKKLVHQTLQSQYLPSSAEDMARLKDLILKRQLRGLKDIANHALVVEQSAIAPLTMGIIHYKRYREIQEAMTTFINDEAKHSATFRRFLVEKLEAKEFISDILIKGANRYMWLARFMPGVGLFLAVIVEAIGAAYLEFFGDEKYMPDKLFCSICKTISTQDEKRHMDLCVAMYNELFRTGQKWERIRNMASLKILMKSIYGDKTEDHHLIQAFRAFGVESEALYQHIMGRLSQQLARINLYVGPEKLLEIIGRH